MSEEKKYINCNKQSLGDLKVKNPESYVYFISIADSQKKIQGLEGFENLTHLDLSSNDISIIENISHLKHIYSIDLSSNKIDKVQGFYGIGRSLTHLDLGNNKIENMKGFLYLGKYTNLKFLYLGNNNISKIEGLEDMFNIRCISLYGNPITHITKASIDAINKKRIHVFTGGEFNINDLMVIEK